MDVLVAGRELTVEVDRRSEGWVLALLVTTRCRSGKEKCSRIAVTSSGEATPIPARPPVGLFLALPGYPADDARYPRLPSARLDRVQVLDAPDPHDR